PTRPRRSGFATSATPPRNHPQNDPSGTAVVGRHPHADDVRPSHPPAPAGFRGRWDNRGATAGGENRNRRRAGCHPDIVGKGLPTYGCWGGDADGCLAIAAAKTTSKTTRPQPPP